MEEGDILEFQVTLDWSVGSDAPAQPVNVVLAQGLGEDVILTFGHAPPPIETASMTNEQTADFLKDHPVKVLQITRFTLPERVAKILMTIIQANLSGNNAEFSLR